MNLEKECLKVDILKKQTKRLSKPQKNQPQSRKIGNVNPDKRIRIMFQYEAGFGRVNKPKYYRCNNKIRPSVPCRHIREYRYAYGAADPFTGENFFF